RARVAKVTLSLVAAMVSATLVLSTGVSGAAPAFASRVAKVPHAPAYTPTFEPGACSAGVPDVPRVACGVLTVPENRNRPQRAEVHLPVAIVRSQSAAKAPDPIVLLVGGPGDPAFLYLPYVLGADLGGARDVIAI